MLSRHMVKIRLKLVFNVKGQPALIKNPKNVIYFLLSKFNKLEIKVFYFLFTCYRFCRISFRHLYFVIYGARHGDYFNNTMIA